MNIMENYVKVRKELYENDIEPEYEPVDLDEMSYQHSVDVPTEEELNFYAWFLENPKAGNREVIEKAKGLSSFSFIKQKFNIDALRDLLNMDLSHCTNKHDKSFQKAEAIRLFLEGESMTFSTGICESTTQGFGRLGHYGYWEHPITRADLDRSENDVNWVLKKGKY